MTAEMLNRLRLADKINADVKERLDDLHGQSSKFEANFSSIRDKLLIKATNKINEKPSSDERWWELIEADVFYKHFDRPEIPQRVVLDFTTCDQNEEPVTAEGRLMRKVLTLSRGGEACGVSAIGSHGMAGLARRQHCVGCAVLIK
eukprot:IDg5480t1